MILGACAGLLAAYPSSKLTTMYLSHSQCRLRRTRSEPGSRSMEQGGSRYAPLVCKGMLRVLNLSLGRGA